MNPTDIINTFINQLRSGVKTSEFWLVLAAGVWNAVYPAYNPHESWKVQVGSLGVLALAALYAGVRGYVKGKHNGALADIIAAINAAINAVAGTTPSVVPPVSPVANTTPPATPVTPVATVDDEVSIPLGVENKK